MTKTTGRWKYSFTVGTLLCLCNFQLFIFYCISGTIHLKASTLDIFFYSCLHVWLIRFCFLAVPVFSEWIYFLENHKWPGTRHSAVLERLNIAFLKTSDSDRPFTYYFLDSLLTLKTLVVCITFTIDFIWMLMLYNKHKHSIQIIRICTSSLAVISRISRFENWLNNLPLNLLVDKM